ncbi:unnamed protein product [Prorocentrum cordatum]|uniref:Ubiquitin-like domain-containing protein n=1 Tax=Prorocentrum cordatum TaxID=2364126 RepID=A0ABN9V3D1_9DINO|nr:unnamed protein product [Polarella glacialis]
MLFAGKDATEEFDMLHDRKVIKKYGIDQGTVDCSDRRGAGVCAARPPGSSALPPRSLRRASSRTEAAAPAADLLGASPAELRCSSRPPRLVSQWCSAKTV